VEEHITEIVVDGQAAAVDAEVEIEQKAQDDGKHGRNQKNREG
jgi:hypothetical protein